jgi:Matrixin
MIALGFVATATWAPHAFAFCRTTTASGGAVACPTTGNPLFWRNACVGFRVSATGSTRIEANEANRIAALGFGVWNNSACAGGGNASINPVSLGLSQTADIGVVERGPNENLIVFRDAKWPYPETNQVALTTVSYRKDTGEILDADMEINTTLAISSTATPPRDGFDFQSVIAHEAGHFLGLAHSEVAGTTMFARYVPGTTGMRSLEADDVSGICTTYPDGDLRVTGAGNIKAGACDPNTSPLNVLAAATSPGCCATTPGASNAVVGKYGWALGAAGCAMLLVRRRRARS